MNILLVEPDRKLAETYEKALELNQHQVKACATAQQAILAADAAKPDVVVLELQLVGHSGVEFLHEFRSYADWQSIPVIILSSVSPQEFRGSEALLKHLGVAAYYYKPRTSLKTLFDSIVEVSQTSLVLKDRV